MARWEPAIEAFEVIVENGALSCEISDDGASD